MIGFGMLKRVFFKRRRLFALVFLLVTGLASWLNWHLASNPFPIEQLESLHSSPVLFDARGHALSRSLTEEEQWRLPVSLEDMSHWLRKAIVAIED